MMPGVLVGIQCSGAEEDAVKAFLGRLGTPGTATGDKIEMWCYASKRGVMISLLGLWIMAACESLSQYFGYLLRESRSHVLT